MKKHCLLLLTCALAAATAHADVVVIRGGEILEGKVTHDNDVVTVAGRKVPVRDVLLWENADGKSQLDTDLDSWYRGVAALARREADGVLDIARTKVREAALVRLDQAIKADAPSTARTLLDRAEATGLAPDEAEKWDRRIDDLKGTGEEAGKEIAIPGREIRAGILTERAAAYIENGKEIRGLWLLRDALRARTDFEPALDLLDEVAPGRFFRKTAEQAKKDIALPKAEKRKLRVATQRRWLDWKLDVFASGVRWLKRRHPDMERARNIWRKDLSGIESPEIIFVTSMERSEIVSMCVGLARITCMALDKMFRIDEPKRGDFLPLIVYFYRDKEEYVATSNQGGPSPGLAMTAGHYSPGVNVSRFYWPNRPDAVRSVRDTFVHELTHHWIERRNPRWHARDLAGMGERVEMPGYWIAEGFATFIEEGRYDRRKRKWTHFNPHAHSLDVVAAVSKMNKLIPWEEQYPFTQTQFHTDLKATASKAHCVVKEKWSLRPVPISKIRLFYEQAASTCHFLYWGEDGKYRAQLLDYVTNFYTSQKDKTTIQAAFGMTPQQLGKKVEQYAIKVMDGWRPKGA